MSITVCKHCDVVLEGEQVVTFHPSDGETNVYCPYCGQEASELPEEEPCEHC